MPQISYAEKVIAYLYEEGEYDWIAFGQLVGYVASDENDVAFGKSDDEIFRDALSVGMYLIDSGDFFVGSLNSGHHPKGHLSPFQNGKGDFLRIAHQYYESEGLQALELIAGIWFEKTNHGKMTNEPTDALCRIFRS